MKTLAQDVKGSIIRGTPENDLDRLHTLTVKVLRAIGAKYEIPCENDKAIHAVMGQYVNRLRQNDEFKTGMTRTILTTVTRVMAEFNDVRNNWSHAHDNPVVDPEEALLICTHVCASLRFIMEREGGLTSPDEPVEDCRATDDHQSTDRAAIPDR
jgi:hypothetical protein